MDEEMRKEFEDIFPIPKNCIRCGDGYAVTSYSAWDADCYVQKWIGWKAAREAMKPIKLPDMEDFKGIEVQWDGENETAYDALLEDDYKEAVVAAIQQAGYKVEE